MEKHSSLDLLLETGLRHLYNSEKEVLDNLKSMADAAHSPSLRQLLLHHQLETETQIKRLNMIFQILDIDIQSSKLRGIPSLAEKGRELLKTLVDMNFTDSSKGMSGILTEGRELMRHFANTDAKDLALINAGQKIEHFEVACYLSLCDLADKYGLSEVCALLKDSLDEERAMASKLEQLASDPMLTASIKQGFPAQYHPI